MAEICRFGSFRQKPDVVPGQDAKFCLFNIFCVFISFITILADLATDLTVIIEYSRVGSIFWAIATILFILVPNCIVNIFSIRWLELDKKNTPQHILTHCLLSGLVERYIIFLKGAFSCDIFEPVKAQHMLSQRNDLCLLHFLYAFTGTVPQVILQVVAIIVLNGNHQTKVLSIVASLASIICSGFIYVYSIKSYENENIQWRSMTLKLVWHFGLLLARVVALVLFAVIFGVWILVPLGFHWTAMTLWIVTQNTTFCPNKIEETFYNVVMGFVYCFCYVNLREGHSRYRLMIFHTLMVSENFSSLLVFIFLARSDVRNGVWCITATIIIILGTFIGICCMILYYRWFHESGPIQWKNINNDIELNNKVATNVQKFQNTSLTHVRSFKSNRGQNKLDDIQTKNECSVEQPSPGIRDGDKKILLDHLIARTGTPTFMSVPIGDHSMEAPSVEIYSIENTPQIQTTRGNPQGHDHKKNSKSVLFKDSSCRLNSLEQLTNSFEEIDKVNFTANKRRGICSSDELKKDFNNLAFDGSTENGFDPSKNKKSNISSDISDVTEGSHKKTSSDSIDLDLDLSLSDINSSDINTFNENIVQKLCLSALKNIKVGNQDADIENIQKIAVDILKEMYAKKEEDNNLQGTYAITPKPDLETTSETLSVHDYENICAVNIAREAWGLRSWNGYIDIENWLHDGSTVRDRRRDTLTSASSEISSCISQDLKNSILSAPTFSKKAHTYSNILFKFDRNAHPDYANAFVCASDAEDTFIARPCVIDMKDNNQLEPILEELDDLGDIGVPNKKRINPESSLVATIDEIRNCTVNNSPRNWCHRPDNLWDSPQSTAAIKIESNLRKALWKEPSKFNSSNIMKSFPDKENGSENCTRPINKTRKELNVQVPAATLDLNSSDEILRCGPKPLNLSSPIKKINNAEDFTDNNSKNIDILWKFVSDRNNPSSSFQEYLASNTVNSSLQSLIAKDIPADSLKGKSKVSNIKKTHRSKPRRKFSILRERFEPRILNQDSQSVKTERRVPLSTVVNVKNILEKK